MAASRRVSSPALVGRREELASIRSVISDMAGAQAQVVVIGGESGVGKTRLLAEATAELDDRVRVLRGHCLALGARLPYLPFSEIIRNLVRDLGPDEARTLLGPAGPELAQLVPEIGETVGSPRSRSRGGSELQRLRLFETVLRLVERIAQDRPTVFAFEDLQWADSASLDLLSFLSHNVRRGDVTLVVTVRTEALDAGSPVLPFLAELERGTNVLRIELERLDREATRRQIAAILGSGVTEATADRIWEQGDGNPLFTEELVAVASAGDELRSPRLRDLLSARTARLPADVLKVLRVAAVLGRSIDVELLSATSALDRETVERAMEAAIDEQVLVRSGHDAAFRFRHELVRSVVAEQLVAPEARATHAAYAEALRSRPDVDVSEVAFHWDAAHEAPQALRWHAKAGFAAEARYAYMAAFRHYERVLELWSEVADSEALAEAPRLRFLQRASTAAARAGQYDRAIALAREFLAEAPAQGDLTELVRSSLRWYLWEAGRADEALIEARAAVERISPETSPRWRANATAHLAGLLLVHGEVGDARRRAEDALELARAADATDEEVLASGIIGDCLLLEGDIDAGIERITEALEGAHRIEEANAELPADQLEDRRYAAGVVLASTQLVAAYEVAERPEDAARVAEAGYARAVEQGVSRTYGATLRAASARALYHSGDWDEALDIIDGALRHGAWRTGRVGLLAISALIHVARNDDEAADEALRMADDDSGAASATEVVRWLAVAHGERLAWAERPLEALAIITNAYEGSSDATRGASLGQAVGLDASLPRLLSLAARASADLALLERAGSMEAAASQLSIDHVRSAIRRIRRRPGLAVSWAPDLALAQAELARAEHALGRRTVSRWQKAAEATRGRPYAEAYARWRLAAALLGDRQRADEAAAEIEQASRLAETLRAIRLQKALSELARRAGLGREGATAGQERPFGLTERELEVLGLLAAGLGNSQIAEQLFISPKTASVHVSNIYGKLGVETRVAAATLAHDLGLAADPDQSGTPTGD